MRLGTLGCAALGGLVGMAALALPGNHANALSLPVAKQQQAQDENTLRQDVQVRRKWDRRRHGDRSRNRSDRHRYYRDGYYYRTPWWALAIPGIIGGAIINESRGINRGRNHVEWCSDRYRSYNPRTNTWVSYSGEVRQCNSPY